MIRRFRRFEPGKPLEDQLTAGRLNAMIDGILERTPNPGSGTQLSTNSTGFSYSATPGDGGRRITLPFTMQAAGDQEIKLTPGIVQFRSSSYTPTINGTPIDAETPPTLTVQGGQYVYLKAEATYSTALVPVSFGSEIERYVISEMIGQPSFSFVVDSANKRGQEATGGVDKAITYYALGGRAISGNISQSAWGNFTCTSQSRTIIEFDSTVSPIEEFDYVGAAYLELTPGVLDVA